MTSLKTYLFLLIFCWPLYLSAQGQEPMIISRIRGEIKLDGKIEEQAWKEAREIQLVQSQPDFGKAPTEKTEVLIGYTEAYLYIACKCYDREKPSSASFKRDYAKGDSDWFQVNLDSFNDNENMLTFATTPTGIRTDIAVSNDAAGSSSMDLGWNSFWEVEVIQNEDGYFVEMRIPVSSLRFQPDNQQVSMGLTVVRRIARLPEVDVFPAIPPNWPLSVLKASQAQKIVFQDLKSAKLLQVTPFALAGFGQQNILDDLEEGYQLKTDPTLNAGLDVKYGLTSNLTLDLTVNTDFAQVEADNQQVNLTRFPLFFPKKRGFFLERASNFDFNFGGLNRLFYSRRIGIQEGLRVPILGGARLVGREGPWDIGFLNMQTGRQETENGKVFHAENFGVLRLRRQVINPFSYVGGIITNRVGIDGSYNVAYGLDGIFRLSRNDYLSVKWAQTFDDSSPNQVASFNPARIQFQWERRTYEGFIYDFQFDRAGQHYKPELGFELREDLIRLGNSVGYGWLSAKGSLLQRHQLSLFGEAYFRNTDGTIESLSIGPSWTFSSKTGHSLNVSASQRIEDLVQGFYLSDKVQVPLGYYSFQVGELSYAMPDRWPLRANVQLSSGGIFDGWQNTVQFRPVWNISNHLRLEGEYLFNQVKFPKREDTFISHIGRLRLELTPNVKFSMMAFIQYNSTTEGLAGNVRFRYNPREGNDLYLVFNENLNMQHPYENPVRPLTDSRTLIMKYTYTFTIH